MITDALVDIIGQTSLFIGRIVSVEPPIAYVEGKGNVAFVHKGVGARPGDVGVFMALSPRKHDPTTLALIITFSQATLAYLNETLPSIAPHDARRRGVVAPVAVPAGVWAKGKDGLWSRLGAIAAPFSDVHVFWQRMSWYGGTPPSTALQSLRTFETARLTPFAGAARNATPIVEHFLVWYENEAMRYRDIGGVEIGSAGMYTFEIASTQRLKRGRIIVSIPTLNGQETFECIDNERVGVIRISALCRERGFFYAVGVTSANVETHGDFNGFRPPAQSVQWRIVQRSAQPRMFTGRLICPTFSPTSISAQHQALFGSSVRVPSGEERGIWVYDGSTGSWQHQPTPINATQTALGTFAASDGDDILWSRIWNSPANPANVWIMAGISNVKIAEHRSNQPLPGSFPWQGDIPYFGPSAMWGFWGKHGAALSGGSQYVSMRGSDARPAFAYTTDGGQTWQWLVFRLPANAAAPDAATGEQHVYLFTLEFRRDAPDHIWAWCVYRGVGGPGANDVIRPPETRHAPGMFGWKTQPGQTMRVAYYSGPLQPLCAMTEIPFASDYALVAPRPCYLDGNRLLMVIQRRRANPNNPQTLHSIVEVGVFSMTDGSWTQLYEETVVDGEIDRNGYPTSWINDYGIVTWHEATEKDGSIHWGHTAFIDSINGAPHVRSTVSLQSLGRRYAIPMMTDQHAMCLKPAFVGDWAYYLSGLTIRHYPNQRSAALRWSARQVAPLTSFYDADPGFVYNDPMKIMRRNFVTGEIQTLSRFGACDIVYDRTECTWEFTGFIYGGWFKTSPSGQWVALRSRDRYNRRRTNVTTIIRHDAGEVETIEGPRSFAWLSEDCLALDDGGAL